MDDAELTHAWIKNPLVDPDTGEKLTPYSPVYDELYNIAYRYLQEEKGLDKQTIKKRLPKNHLLFQGKYDLLYYGHNKDDFTKDEQEIYEFIKMSGYKFGNHIQISKEFKSLVNHSYGVMEWIICYNAFDDFAEYTQRYIEYLDNLLEQPDKVDGHYTHYKYQADMIKEQYEQIRRIQKNARELEFTSQLQKVANSEWAAKYIDKKSEDTGLDIKLKSNKIMSAFTMPNADIYDTLISLFKDLEKIYDYERKPNQSPIVVLKPLEAIQDPVEETIHKMYAESLANSMSQVALSSPVFPIRSAAKSSSKISKTIQNRALKIYKEMHEFGLEDLMKTTTMFASSISSRKDRKYFKDNILYSADNNKLKCNHNIDGITQDDMNDDKYPLAKLQLIFQLHTRDQLGNVVRTDCFYAPAFYNYIVSKVLHSQELVNPITTQRIKRSDIDNLINIMKLIVPDIPHPFIKTYDKELMMYVVLSSDAKYYEFIIIKTFTKLKLKICQVCLVPNIQDKADDIMQIIHLMKQIFDKQLLLHNYMPPYCNANKEYVKLPFLSTYNKKDYWRTNKERKMDALLQNLQEILQN